MISISGDVKLLDFGIARAETEALGGRLEGKIAYAAPEQLRGDNVDRRSDLWAVGILLYESLCGVRPYEFKEPHLMEEAARQGVYTPIGALRPEAIPLEEIIARSLKYEPNERWTDAESNMNALSALAKQFSSVTATQMADLVHSAGGPAKSVLGVEQITSFGGTAVGDPSNRTATIPITDRQRTNPESLDGINASSLKASEKKPIMTWLLAAILITIVGLAAVAIQQKRAQQAPVISSVPLPVEVAKPKPVAKPKSETPAQVPELKPVSKPSAKPQVSPPDRVKPDSKDSIKKRAKAVSKPAKKRPLRSASTVKSSRKTVRPVQKNKPKPAPVVASPTPPPKPKPVAAQEPGRLSVSSTPWAQIQINGESLGETPKMNIQLPAGKHRLVLTPADGTPGARKVMMIQIKPKQHLRIIANFDANTFRTLGN